MHREDGRWFVSAFVEDEVKNGNLEAARKRLQAIAGIPRLDVAPGVMSLASAFLAGGLIPKKAAMDAYHIAIATYHEMDVLVT